MAAAMTCVVFWGVRRTQTNTPLWPAKMALAFLILWVTEFLQCWRTVIFLPLTIHPATESCSASLVPFIGFVILLSTRKLWDWPSNSTHVNGVPALAARSGGAIESVELASAGSLSLPPWRRIARSAELRRASQGGTRRPSCVASPGSVVVTNEPEYSASASVTTCSMFICHFDGSVAGERKTDSRDSGSAPTDEPASLGAEGVNVGAENPSRTGARRIHGTKDSGLRDGFDQALPHEWLQLSAGQGIRRAGGPT